MRGATGASRTSSVGAETPVRNPSRRNYQPNEPSQTIICFSGIYGLAEDEGNGGWPSDAILHMAPSTSRPREHGGLAIAADFGESVQRSGAGQSENDSVSAGHFVTIEGDQSHEVFLVLERLNTLDGLAARLWRIIPEAGPFDDLVPYPRLRVTSVPFDEPWRSISGILAEALERPLADAPIVAFTARTVFKPFQFRPLLKFFGESGRRLLIADETGLGKTIEAGYIIVEEVARLAATRVLILCPRRLRRKWRTEMWRRFGLPFRVVSGRGLEETLNNKERPFLAIASMDAGREMNLGALERLPGEKLVDLLVLDEVHRMIGRGDETIRRRLGLALAQASGSTLGLSATPVQIELDDLRRVLDVVAPGWFDEEAFDDELEATALVNQICRNLSMAKITTEDERALSDALQNLRRFLEGHADSSFDDLRAYAFDFVLEPTLRSSERRWSLRREAMGRTRLSRVVTRARAKEVGEDRRRLVRTLYVELGSEPREAFQDGKKVRITEAEFYKIADDFLHNSFSHVHRLQLSSCVPAMVGLLRLGALGFSKWRAWDGDEHMEGSDEVQLSAHERQECQRLAGLHELLPTDSKWEGLARLLNELQAGHSARKAIVFTHWIPTYRYLTERLATLRGRFFAVPPEADDERIEQEVSKFSYHEGFAVLLATDLLREGLDIQAADCVINYDLPYNPQAVEQRIGRVDRIGQKSEAISVVNVVVRGSLDERIYQLVLSRIGVFERFVGDTRPILEEMADRATRTGSIDEDAVVREAAMLEDRRRLMEHGAFQVLEDVLDDEIRQAHASRSSGPRGLEWVVMTAFFRLMDNRLRVEWKPDTRTLTVTGLQPSLVNAIETTVGLEAKEEVGASLRASLERHGAVRLRLGGGEDSLPVSHPLLMFATRVVAAAAAEPGRRFRPAFLQMEAVHGVPSGLRHLFLIEYAYEGTALRRRHWVWWGVSAAGRVAELKDLDTSKLFVSCLDFATPSPPAASSLLQEVEEASGGAFEEWSRAHAMRDLSLREISARSSLRTLRARIRGLEERREREESEGDAVEQLISRLKTAASQVEQSLEEVVLPEDAAPPGTIGWKRALLGITLREETRNE